MHSVEDNFGAEDVIRMFTCYNCLIIIIISNVEEQSFLLAAGSMEDNNNGGKSVFCAFQSTRSGIWMTGLTLRTTQIVVEITHLREATDIDGVSDSSNSR